MEIKYEAVFGDQGLFDRNYAPEDCEIIGDCCYKVINGNINVWNFSEKKWCNHYAKSFLCLAMRRIIRTPTWTKEDQMACKLPEVGAKVDGGVIVFVNSFNVVIELETGAVIVTSPKTFLNTFKPIEPPEEKEARLRAEWYTKARELYQNSNSDFKAVYDALLSGDLPVPVKVS